MKHLIESSFEEAKVLLTQSIQNLAIAKRTKNENIIKMAKGVHEAINDYYENLEEIVRGLPD